MNIIRKHVERKKCTRCGHIFLQIGGVKIRSIRIEIADYDPKTGGVKEGLCNSPRCARFGVRERMTDDDDDLVSASP